MRSHIGFGTLHSWPHHACKLLSYKNQDSVYTVYARAYNSQLTLVSLVSHISLSILLTLNSLELGWNILHIRDN